MRGTLRSDAFRLVACVLLVLVVAAPCLNLAAGMDQLHVGGKRVHQGWLAKVPWASAPAVVWLPAVAAARAAVATDVGHLPVVPHVAFVPPEV